MRYLLLLFIFLPAPFALANEISRLQGKSGMEKYAKPGTEELKALLSSEQYHVTQKNGTERPFENAYWDNKEAGIYVDVVSGEPLFSSLDKFDSGTGWPSFTKPLKEENVQHREDRKFFMHRTEVRSKHADSHLGHVFDDGPAPTGMRYCMNSAAMRFIPVAKLAEEGYAEFLPLFEMEFSTESDAENSTDQKNNAAVETATLAGGCFWGVQELLRALPGVLSTRVGYTGGHVENATYKEVSSGTSGHAESIEITFDPTRISYAELLDFFFRIHDPTTLNRQGNDQGTQYRSQVFYHSEQQKLEAEKAIERAGSSGRWKSPVVTTLSPVAEFFEAEEYHQDYLQKNPGGYSCHFVRD